MNSRANITNCLRKHFNWLLAVESGVLVLGLTVANSSAQTYTILHSFTDGADGGHPACAQLVLSGTSLYGTTSGAGSAGLGTVFKLSTDGTSYTVLKNFNGSDGSAPVATMVLSGSTLYGTTAHGGTSDWGTLFKVDTDGSSYAVLKNFTGTDGVSPWGGLALSNGVLYGTTTYGGDFGHGTVFKLGTDGSGYTVLHSFSYSNEGDLPESGPVLCGDALYGTTSDGDHCAGTIYRVNIDGSGFMVLKALLVSSDGAGADGIWPCSPLVASGTTLYGTADWGGKFNSGTLFLLNTDGSGFNVLKHFTGSGGDAGVQAGLLLSGTNLYGTTYEGDDSPIAPPYWGHGTVFRINTDGSGFVVLKQFTGSDGAHPRAGLVMSGTTLFGMTDFGGSSNCGVIFSISVAPPTVETPPCSQTAEMGSAVGFDVTVTGSPSLTYQWFLNGTNPIGGVTTTPYFMLTSAQPSDCGAYNVVVSNLFGAVTSSPAMLNVIVPVPRRAVPGLNLLGQAGSVFGLDYRDTLGDATNWETLVTMTLSNSPQFYLDLSEPLPPQRFYRAWQTGTPSAVPSLSLLGMVQAMALAGNIGDSLRVDCINQFGPIDAWVTLDTVTLTNTPQLYFDVSSIGQPPRLYRLVPVP